MPHADDAAKAPGPAGPVPAPAAAPASEARAAAGVTKGVGNARFTQLVSGAPAGRLGRHAAHGSPPGGDAPDPLAPMLAEAVAVRRKARGQDPPPVSAVSRDGERRVARFWPFTQPKTPDSPNMAPRVASLKNEPQVHLNLSTAYIQRGQEGMDRLVADIDAEMTKYAPADKADVMKVVEGQKRKIEDDRDRFVPKFETNARDTAFVLLDTSKKSIEDEMGRYGMREGTEVKDGQSRGSGKMEVKPTAEMDELAKAAKHLTTEGEKMVNLGLDLKRKYGEKHKGGPMEEAQNRELTEKDLLKDASYVEASQKYEVLYRDYMGRFPILAALKNDPLAVAGLRSGGKSPAANAMVWDKLKEKLDHISETRTNLAPGGKLPPLTLPNVVSGTKKTLAVAPGSLENRFVEEAVAKLKGEKDARDKALLILGVTVAVVAAVATGGGSLVVAAGASGAGLGLSAAQIVDKLQDFQVQRAASDTDMDKAKSISEQDPDLLWLAIDIVLFVADVVAAGKLLRGAAGPVRKMASARAAAERAGGGASAEEAERLTKMLTTEVDPALAGLPPEARQRIRAKLDPAQRMPSVLSTASQGARWTDSTLRAALQQSAAGREALNLMAQHNVKLFPTSKVGAWHEAGSVYISKTMSVDDAAQAFVHEMTHAEWAKTGKTMSPIGRPPPGRFEYINAMCREEAAAEVSRIKHKFGAQATTGKAIQASSPVEKVYSDAFAAEANTLRTANPGMDPAVIARQAEAAGQEALYKAFAQGKVTNSITQESYVIYYGRNWDRANNPAMTAPW